MRADPFFPLLEHYMKPACSKCGPQNGREIGPYTVMRAAESYEFLRQRPRSALDAQV